MKNKKFFNTAVRAASLGLAFSLTLGLLSGCGEKSGKDGGKNDGKKIETLFAEPVEFSVMTYEHPSNKYNTDGLKFELLKKYANVTIDFNITPQSSYTSKKTAALLSGTLSDFTFVYASDIPGNAASGNILKLDEYLESSLSNLYNRVKDDKNWTMSRYEGSTYFLPVIGITLNAKGNGGGIMPIMRTDLLEKNNIAAPKTVDEWFNVMKKLKSVYPDSTPFSGRQSGVYLLKNMELSMGCTSGLFYDYKTEKYRIGALAEEYKSIVEFWKKCYDEGVLDPNWKSLNSNSWDEGVNANKIFFWFDNAGISVTQTATLRKTDPDAQMTAIPLMANSKGEKFGLAYSKTYNEGYAINAKSDKLDKIIKFADWMYSDEGFRICNYGEEGTNYTLDSDGTVVLDKEFADKYKAETNPIVSFQNDNGFGQGFFSLLSDNYLVPLEKALGINSSSSLDDVFLADYEAGNYKLMVPDVYVKASDATSVAVMNKSVNTLISSEIPKFVEGTRPMTEWNQFVADLNKAGAETIEKAYNDALNSNLAK